MLPIHSTRRTALIVAMLALFLVLGGIVAARRWTGEAGGAGSLTVVESAGRVRCERSAAELAFDPDGRIEVRLGGRTVASADARGRALNYDACAAQPPRGGFFVRIRKWRVNNETRLICRFPGHFLVQVVPITVSDPTPDGSAVALVLGKRVKPGPYPKRTLIPSASVGQFSWPGFGWLYFSPDYCTRQ